MAGVILASKSPRRHVLLRYLLDDFRIEEMDVNEDAPRHLPVEDAVEVIARKKALAASGRFTADWILAADTIVAYHGQLVDKATDEADARQKLAMLCGETHQVWTGLALAWNGRIVDDRHAVSAVHIDRMPRAAFDAYLESGSWQGKAGGYGIQDPLLAPYVTVQSGPWSNVVGLPLAATREMLVRNGIRCKEVPDEAEVQRTFS